MPGSASPAVDEDSLSRLLAGVNERYGYDFTGYAKASLTRRILRCASEEGLTSLDELRERLLASPELTERFVESISVHVSSMFRDPDFFLVLRRQVAPILRSWPYLRLWVAGCSTGEELYSLAILLEEEGLIDRSRLYATDLSHRAIERARAGIFPLGVMREFTGNYLKSGGKRDFSSYYTAGGDRAIMSMALRRNVAFAMQNLVSDGAPNEFHAIICRNVLIYFGDGLQARVHGLFCENLVRQGFLCLGRKESIRSSSHSRHYEAVDEAEKIYRKIS